MFYIQQIYDKRYLLRLLSVAEVEVKLLQTKGTNLELFTSPTTSRTFQSNITLVKPVARTPASQTCHDGMTFKAYHGKIIF